MTALTTTARARINVTGGRGPRGFASGPLGAGSVTAEEISDDPDEQVAITQKIGFRHVGPNAVARPALDKLREMPLSLADFAYMGGIGQGDANADTAALKELVATGLATGKPMHVPEGTWKLNDTVTMRPGPGWAEEASFTSGPILEGAGQGKTIILAEGDDAGFDLDSDAAHTSDDLQFVVGGAFRGLSLIGDGSSSTSRGIKLRSAYNIDLTDLFIDKFAFGVEIEMLAGDYDGSNQVKLESVRIQKCSKWGLYAPGSPGSNENSWLILHRAFFAQNGTDAADVGGVPQSGGMIWKGQIGKIDQAAFLLNHNVGLYVPGTAGLGNTLVIDGVDFEHNSKRHMLVTGFSGITIRDGHMYSHDSMVAAAGIELVPTGGWPVLNVKIDGMIVRVPASSPDFVAVRNVLPDSLARIQVTAERFDWQNFGHDNQKRFEGVFFGGIPQEAELAFAGSNVLLRPSLRGSCTPYRRATNGGGGSPSNDGEFVPYFCPTGGLSVSAAGLSDGTYHVYLYDNDNTPTLIITDETPTDPARLGYRVGSTNGRYVHKGRCAVSSGSLVTGGAARWLNPLWHESMSYVWRDATGAARYNLNLPASDTDGTLI